MIAHYDDSTRGCIAFVSDSVAAVCGEGRCSGTRENHLSSNEARNIYVRKSE